MAVVISAVVRSGSDFYIVLALLVANPVVGFWEEYQADGRLLVGDPLDLYRGTVALFSAPAKNPQGQGGIGILPTVPLRS